MSLVIKENEPLSRHLNFRLGGPARFFIEVRDLKELSAAHDFANRESLPIFVLGGGSNTLASDEGFIGVVVKIINRDFKITGNLVEAGAGVISSTVARKTVEAGLSGFEWAISLPGTIGGAVRGNAGCFGGEMKDSVESVVIWQDGEVKELPAVDLHFGYRDSAFKHSLAGAVIWSVKLRLASGNRTIGEQKLAETLARRKSTQPLGASSAGCMFKNFDFTDLAQITTIAEKVKIPQEMLDKKRLGAGFIIDSLGLKGVCVGEACVSKEHGNFLTNIGSATANQVKQLIDLIKAKVKSSYGLELEEEVKIIGF